jgi:hypothetical protein
MPLKEHIKLHISSNKKTHCEINSHEIYDEDVNEIVALLNQLPHVKILEIGQTNITDEGIVLLNRLTHVTYLTLKRGNFGDDGAIALVRNERFKGLNFHGNSSITDEAGVVMANESQQTFLDVSDTSITEGCKEKIVARVSNNKGAAYTSASSSRFFDEKKDPGNRFDETLMKAQHDRDAVQIKLRKI